MSKPTQLNRYERFLTLFTRVEAGEGRCIGILSLQAFTLMLAYYLIRPVREALILTEGTAELRSYAVGVQALLLILVIPAYALLVRRVASNRVFQWVIGFFAANLVVFFLLGQAGARFSFVFFVWASIFAVMAVAQFWAFATDLFHVNCGTRLFGVIAVGVSGGAWIGASLASAGFEALGPYGLMLASAGVLCLSIYLSFWARRAVPATSRSAQPDSGSVNGLVGRWLGGIAVVSRSRYLIGIAALVVLLNWITSTGDFVLSSWLVEVAHEQAPQDEAAYIGKFMGKYCSTITLVGFLIQLLLVSRIINAAGLARALMITPVAFLAGYFVIGILPVFALLQSALIVQKSLDYSLLNTARSALLLPTSREEKYQAKTAIDTLFYRLGDLLSTLAIFIGLRIVDDARLQFVWLIVLLSATMILVAWLIGREYARRYGADGESSGNGDLPIGGGSTALAQ
ncbi:MAG: NTP/NDP exchange transporter [Steroidobacteraceae bacterium]